MRKGAHLIYSHATACFAFQTRGISATSSARRRLIHDHRKTILLRKSHRRRGLDQPARTAGERMRDARHMILVKDVRRAVWVNPLDFVADGHSPWFAKNQSR